MNLETKHGIAFLAIVGVAAGVWYYHRKSTLRSLGVAVPVENVVTTDAGNITPEPSVSNVKPMSLDDEWNTPYYLRANYPDDRPTGNVIPSIVEGSTPQSFGPQEIPSSI